MSYAVAFQLGPLSGVLEFYFEADGLCQESGKSQSNILLIY